MCQCALQYAVLYYNVQLSEWNGQQPLIFRVVRPIQFNSVITLPVPRTVHEAVEITHYSTSEWKHRQYTIAISTKMPQNGACSGLVLGRHVLYYMSSAEYPDINP